MKWGVCFAVFGFVLCTPLMTPYAEEKADVENKEIKIPLFHPKQSRWQSARITMAPRGCDALATLTMALTEDRRNFTKFELQTDASRYVIPAEDLKDYLFPWLEFAGVTAWCSDSQNNEAGGYIIRMGYSLTDNEYALADESSGLFVIIGTSGKISIEQAKDTEAFLKRNRDYRRLMPARWHAASIDMTPRGCERDVELDVGLTSNRRHFTGLSLTTPSGHFSAPLEELREFAYPTLESMRIVGWCDMPDSDRREGYEVSMDYSLAQVEYALEEETSEVSVTLSTSGDIEICDDYDFLACWEQE